MKEMKTLNGYEVVDEEAREQAEQNAPTVGYVETETVYLGENVIGSATLGSGWTAEDGVYTHANSGAEDLTLATNVEVGQIYLLRFKSDYDNNEFVRVGLGEQYRVRCYQGGENIVVPLYAAENNATLYFTPDDAKPAFTITDLALCKIQDSGEEVSLELYSTTTENHEQNYGFWNTFIGNQTAENAVGSTRCIAIGKETLRDLQGGHRNIAIGTFAMSQLVGGEENVSIGSDSMIYVKNADGCVAIGMSAMNNGASHKEDIAIGKGALKGTGASATEGNVAIGKYAGNNVTTAKSNVVVGQNAGYNITNGSMNTFIGSEAGKNSTSWGSTAIGAQADTGAYSKSIAIGYQAKATKSLQAVLGSDDITQTLLKGDLVVRGTDGVKRQIVFNEDGTCSWTGV